MGTRETFSPRSPLCNVLLQKCHEESKLTGSYLAFFNLGEHQNTVFTLMIAMY